MYLIALSVGMPEYLAEEFAVMYFYPPTEVNYWLLARRFWSHHRRDEGRRKKRENNCSKPERLEEVGNQFENWNTLTLEEKSVVINLLDGWDKKSICRLFKLTDTDIRNILIKLDLI